MLCFYNAFFLIELIFSLLELWVIEIFNLTRKKESL